MLRWTRVPTCWHAATSLVYSPALYALSLQAAGHVTQTVDRRNYVTAFQVADRPLVDDSQLCAFDVDIAQCGSLSDYYTGIFQHTETLPRTL